MRLLQLQLSGNDGGSIDFHPMLTVVSGLTPSARARVIAAFSALPRAGDPGCGGLLESHGVLLDLTPANLSLLGLTDVELDVLVRPEDIQIGPRQDGWGVARVEQRLFLGDRVQLRLSAAGLPGQLLADVARDTPFQSGDEVGIHIDPQRLMSTAESTT